MFVCQGDECAGDVPAPIKTHHFGLHVPIGCLQTRDNWRYHGNKWCCARHTRTFACTFVYTQTWRWKAQKWGYFLIAENSARLRLVSKTEKPGAFSAVSVHFFNCVLIQHCFKTSKYIVSLSPEEQDGTRLAVNRAYLQIDRNLITAYSKGQWNNRQ